ncbi:MAG: tail-specific protease [Verrucomicrobia bacterium]|nr:tail-specific protease [Verrucomicrobiota bacterium]
MKFPYFSFRILLGLCLLGPGWLCAKDPDPTQVTIGVASLLEQVHYSKQRLNKDISRRLLRNFLEYLDYNHFIFNSEDVEGFTKRWAENLDSELVFGRTEAAKEIHEVFVKRVEERVARANELLAGELDYSSDGSIEANRQKAEWPTAGAAMEQLWHDRITSEMIQERLNKKETNPAAIVKKRYDQYLRSVHEQTTDDAVKMFLLNLTMTYDPHSEYMSKTDQEQFNISMRLSLFGIGARLRSEDGYTKVDELIPGGPASKTGKMKAGDRIVGVAQGDEAFVDCVDMRLDKVISMIRGDKDTVVRLQIIPAGAALASERQEVLIKRDEIKLKEGEAHADLYDWPRPDGGTIKLGRIQLPSFYRDMTQNGNPNAKSTTRDVLTLLNRLKAEGIEGLIIDLRNDGGGSLEEAISLTGLFIKDGPVVQVRNWNGEVVVNRDEDPRIAYDGPLVVMVNRHSASASEIFAGAMQDYKRAIVVGDSKTFGKGTVQQLIELNRVIPMLSKEPSAGSVKLTIQKFYRAAGGSTQLQGVETDIRLPSLSDQPQFGEDARKNPLPYDTIAPQPYELWGKPLFIEKIRPRSEERVRKSIEFAYIREDLERIRRLEAENRISINEAKRQAEVEEEKVRKKQRDEERAARSKADELRVFRVTLDNAAAAMLTPVVFNKKKVLKEGESEDEPPAEAPKEGDKKDGAPPVVKSDPISHDPAQEEALNILNDLVRETFGLKSGAARN